MTARSRVRSTAGRHFAICQIGCPMLYFPHDILEIYDRKVGLPTFFVSCSISVINGLSYKN